jgi:hypothetical protein
MPLRQDIHQLLATAEPAALGPEKRAGTLSRADIDRALNLPGLSPSVRELLVAVLYLWHDHLDAAHDIAQRIETADGSLVHAIMHRREPDYSNAKYWFRRAGKHAAFLALSLSAEKILDRADESDLRSRLLPNNSWDPMAFVDAVEESSDRFKSSIPLLRDLQRLELEALLDNLIRRAVD